MLQARLKALVPIVQAVLEQGSLPAAGVDVPGEPEHLALVAEFVARTWRAGRRDGLQEVRREVRFDLDTESPLPSDALEFLRQRQALQGKWSRDLDAEVTKVLVHSMSTGADVRTTMRALQRVFPEFGKARLENIARTEATTAYNQGRLAAFREDQEFVTGVQFHAILDSRTTTICQARNGLILRLDDSRLPANTPPLHYQCRSVLVPVDRIVWAKLEAGDKKAEAGFFGYLDGGPRSLEEALKRWDSVPAPLPGFGVVQDVATPKKAKAEPKPRKKRTPKAKPADAAQSIADKVKDAWGTDEVDPKDLARLERVGKLLLDEARKRTPDLDKLPDLQREAKQASKQIERLEAERLRFRHNNPECRKLDLAITQAVTDAQIAARRGASRAELARMAEDIADLAKATDKKVSGLWRTADPAAWRDHQDAISREAVAKNRIKLIAGDVSKTVRDVNREARPGVGVLSTSKPSRLPAPERLVKEIKATVSEVFPKEWIDDSNRVSVLPIARETRRGIGGYYSYESSRITGQPDHTTGLLAINPQADGGIPSIIAHEFGHRVESVRPLIDKVFLELYAQRTKGERSEPLERYMPGAPRAMRVKRDAWTTAYMGLTPYATGGSELFSSGVEFLQGEKIAEFLSEDPQHLMIVLGVMAVL